MYDFAFLKAHRERVLIYKEIPLPVVIASKDLEALWSNDPARLFYANLTHTQGLRRALREYDFNELLRTAIQEGSCTINEFVPFSSVGLKISPIVEEDGTLTGVALFLLRADSAIDAGLFYQSAQMPGVISDSIRDVVSNIFDTLDRAARGSDPVQMGWIKPGMSEVANNSYRILRIATNITEYARYQSELLEFTPRPVCLSAFLWEAAEEVSHLAQQVDIPVSFKVPRKDFFAQVDLTRFQHAFFNILHNAMYYTRPGNRVSVSLRANKTRDFATILIADRGLGIPGHILSELTRPYYAYAHNKAKRGVGLGLAIANLAVETHEWQLRIHSREGHGTTVRIILPLDKGVAGMATLAQSPRDLRLRDRFSTAYVGLSDLALKPFRS